MSIVTVKLFMIDKLIYSGGHSKNETPVPIPNTVVKALTPMVLSKDGRVGYCRESHKNPSRFFRDGFFI